MYLCGNGAHFGYNCPSKVPIVPNPKPFNNQTINELPPTVPSFDSTCYSEDVNSFTYDSTSNLVHDSPNVFDPPPQPLFYSCEFCGNDTRYGYNCTPQISFIYPKPCYNQDFDFPQDFHNFQQQDLCCENCGVPHEAYQCQPMNEDYYHEQNSCYDPNSFGFDQFQPPQYTVNHHIFNVQNDLFNSQNKLMERLISMCDMIDSLFDEFAGELTLLKSIPSGINETDCDPEEEAHFIKRLLYDNLFPRPPKEFFSKNSDIAFESFFSSPIPVEDSDSLMEEIDLSFTPDDPMPPGIEEDDYGSERDILILEELLSNNSFFSSPIPVEDSDSLMEEIDLSFTSDDPMPPGIEEDDYGSEMDILILEELLSNNSLSRPKNESFHFDIPLSYRPPAKPPDGNSGILNVKVMGDISEHKVPMPRIMFTQSTLVPNQEKSPDLLPHRGHEAFQPSAECPIMIYGKNTPILDVSFLYFYPP
nr:hypothetical protein [Tanacetum cinerariifolium]